MTDLYSEIVALQKEINKPENLPKMAFRRNSKAYPLICYVNNITGCFLSKNYDPIIIFVARVEVYIEENDIEEFKNYYMLINKYFHLIVAFIKSIKLPDINTENVAL